jgi:hypothetical protein
MGNCLGMRGASERPLTRLPPPFDGRFNEAGLGAMMGQNLELSIPRFGEIVSQSLRDPGMKRAAWLSQQGAIGRPAAPSSQSD